MSELQISLLAIGIVAVLAVYGYSAWQQREYRRRFGATFNQNYGDALYTTGAPASAGAGALVVHSIAIILFECRTKPAPVLALLPRAVAIYRQHHNDADGQQADL